MIHQSKGEKDPDYPHLRALALRYLQHTARAAAEDPNRLADILGPTEDNPINRAALAKVLENLGRKPPTPLTETRCTRSTD